MPLEHGRCHGIESGEGVSVEECAVDLSPEPQ